MDLIQELLTEECVGSREPIRAVKCSGPSWRGKPLPSLGLEKQEGLVLLEPSRSAGAVAAGRESRERGSGIHTPVSRCFSLAGPTQKVENEEAQEVVQSTKVSLPGQRAWCEGQKMALGDKWRKGQHSLLPE